MVLDAETKIGELLKEIPSEIKGRPSKESIDSAVDTYSSKQKAKQEMGITQKQAERFMKLADNKSIVEQAKAEARENGEIVTLSAIKPSSN